MHAHESQVPGEFVCTCIKGRQEHSSSCCCCCSFCVITLHVLLFSGRNEAQVASKILSVARVREPWALSWACWPLLQLTGPAAVAVEKARLLVSINSCHNFCCWICSTTNTPQHYTAAISINTPCTIAYWGCLRILSRLGHCTSISVHPSMGGWNCLSIHFDLTNWFRGFFYTIAYYLLGRYLNLTTYRYLLILINIFRGICTIAYRYCS